MMLLYVNKVDRKSISPDNVLLNFYSYMQLLGVNRICPATNLLCCVPADTETSFSFIHFIKILVYLQQLKLTTAFGLCIIHTFTPWNYSKLYPIKCDNFWTIVFSASPFFHFQRNYNSEQKVSGERKQSQNLLGEKFFPPLWSFVAGICGSYICWTKGISLVQTL